VSEATAPPSGTTGPNRPVVWLARHGETEWSRTLRHTGRTDMPLTSAGEAEARALRTPLAGVDFDRVLCSPLSRARETCQLAGLGDRAELRDDLLEWDSGDYEGRTSADIHTDRPDWLLWRDGCPGGESPDEVGARADRIIAELLAMEEGIPGGTTVAVFAHGHVLRVLTARWLDLPPSDGRLFGLGTATLSRLGWEHDYRVIQRWNAPV
jgi:probable phosphoglycerate mutase